jgi:hypothetical protein
MLGRNEDRELPLAQYGAGRMRRAFEIEGEPRACGRASRSGVARRNLGGGGRGAPPKCCCRCRDPAQEARPVQDQNFFLSSIANCRPLGLCRSLK